MLNSESENGPNARPSARNAARKAAERDAFTPDRIAGLFRSWDNAQKILLAVSGGPDSIAMMLLANEWARNRTNFGAPAPVLAVATVDHKLRQDSRAEAEQVALWAAELGLPHEILVWDGPKPKTKIQELARAARYNLLFDHAARIGADVVATAHHADDQAETILFRLLRGSGVGGLSGMAASVERGGRIHSRPLLPCAKAELVAFCEALAHRFFADPSNHNPAYARTRMRALAPILAEAGLSRDALLRLGRRAARAEAALAITAEAAAASLAPLRENGRFSADINCLAGEPEEIFLRILALEINALGDAARPLRLDRLETLALGLQQALRDGAAFAATLGGATVQLRRDGRLTIRTEDERRRGHAAER